jgi:hypothetical protein
MEMDRVMSYVNDGNELERGNGELYVFHTHHNVSNTFNINLQVCYSRAWGSKLVLDPTLSHSRSHCAAEH